MENNNPKISVIMPSLNVKDFIQECIESVINQTFKNLEIICVDAGSTDGTLEILQKYAKKDSRIKIIYSDKKSYGYQMNLGISEAKGEYIGIVETDDYIDAQMYETLYNLTNDATTDISKVNFYHFYGINNYKKDQTKKNLPKTKFTVYEDANILNGHPSIWAAIYKKQFLKENNIKFMEEPGGGWVDNPFLFQTTLSAKNITYKNEPFYYYRELNPTSSTNNLKDLTLPMKRMLNVLDILKEYSCNDENILKTVYVRIFWHINDVLKKEKYSQQEEEIIKYTYSVVERMDENIIKNNFGLKNQKLYYKYLSPLNFLEINENKQLNSKEFQDILKENKFLYEYISKLDKNNFKLKSKNKKLNKKIKTLEKKNKLIKNSKTYKLARYLVLPIRLIKKIFN